ncbi:MAG: hypothetical protein PUK24_06620 [Elusimicrobia bacterium]|nr:hypothetical protein [Elusimicrobiota bacterium]MDY6039923.1 hypothetical protein [Elusimicrobiaceae bacterium]
MIQFIQEIISRLDPHRQSFLFFKWNFWRILCVLTAVWCVFQWQGEGFIKTLQDNIFIYFPNYLIHEFAHNIVGRISFMGAYMFSGSCETAARECYPIASWITTLAGNGAETLVPTLGILFFLQLQGGRLVLPPLLYWCGTTWYDAARYVSDARASLLPLTSSDMMTNYAPGTVKGDWHYILQPLGLLDYDLIIGQIFYAVAAFCLVMAVYSLWYYWTHNEEMLLNSHREY